MKKTKRTHGRASLQEQSRERTEKKREKFLAAFATLGTVLAACKKVGISRRVVYLWREHDEAFAQLFDHARQEATDVLEAECRRRGRAGVLEPVYYQGEVVGHLRKYSDTCLLALLNAYRPEHFRNRHEHSGKDGSPLVPAVVHVSYDHNMKPDDMP